jgi:hypothetical protein
MDYGNWMPEYGPCATCQAHDAKKCDHCSKAFAIGEATYQGRSHHQHSIDKAIRSFQPTLCLDCYRKDWAKVESTPCPVEKAPCP